MCSSLYFRDVQFIFHPLIYQRLLFFSPWSINLFPYERLLGSSDLIIYEKLIKIKFITNGVLVISFSTGTKALILSANLDQHLGFFHFRCSRFYISQDHSLYGYPFLSSCIYKYEMGNLVVSNVLCFDVKDGSLQNKTKESTWNIPRHMWISFHFVDLGSLA